MKSRYLSLLLAALLSLAASGCRKADTSAVTTGGRAQILHLGNYVEPTDLDPHVTIDAQDMNIIMALLEGLADYDPQTCEPVPAMAERWEVAADNLTWTFHLRKNAKWSNGDPVTARDFVFAYQRALSPKLGAQGAYLLHALKNGEAFNTGKLTDFGQVGASAPDDFTLVLTLSHPVPYLPTLVCNPVWYPLHRATVEKFGAMDQRGSKWTRPGNFVGNGCFVLADWKPNQVIRVAKNPAYWDRDRVKLTEVDFHPIDSSEAEENAFRAGQLHVTSTLPVSKVAAYKTNHSPFYQNTTMLGTSYLVFNTAKPPLNDPRVRRALSLAIDRETFVRDVLHGERTVAEHFCPPGIAGFTAKNRIAYDPAAAKKLLADAGYPGGKGVPKLEFLYVSNDANRLFAETLQAMWRTKLGVEISLHNQESRAVLASLAQRQFEICQASWGGDYLDPDTFLQLFVTGGGNNQPGWSNAAYDRALAESAASADKATRYAAFERCEAILAEETPVAPIFYMGRSTLRRPEVKGWFNNLLSIHPLKGVFLEGSATAK